MGRRLRKYFFSITAKTFFSLASLFLLPTLLCRGNQTHHSFSPRYISQKSPFCDNGLFEEQNRKQVYMKLGTLMLRGIDLHKFPSPNSSAVRLGSVCANILGPAGG